MRYETVQDLPETITEVLPEEARDLYLEGYQQGWDMYDEETPGELSRDSIAHRQGWANVKQEFEHSEETGKWYRRGEAPETPEEEGGGLGDKVKSVLGMEEDSE